MAPGEFTVLLGGAVAGQGDISLPLILAITWLAAFLGDSVSFLLGHRLGREFLVRHGERVRITEERLKQVEDYFARHGGKTILVGRFIGLVRALAPFIAGTSNMRYRAFWPYSVLGTGLWAATFILVGYFASQSLDEVAAIVSRGLIWFGVFVGLVVGVVVLIRYLRVRANRRKVVAEMERRRALLPVLALARRLRPQARFLWQRLTPGGLGLELTTLMAVLSVGLFVLIAYWSTVAGDPAPTGADSTALDLADDIRAGWLDDLAEGVTFFGSLLGGRPAGAGGGRGARGAAALHRARRAGGRNGHDHRVHERDQGLDGPATAPGRPGRGGRLGVPQQARRLRDGLHLAGRDRRLSHEAGDRGAQPADRGGAGGHGRDRPHARVSARALAERRQLGVGPGFLGLRPGCRHRAGRDAFPRQSPP